MNKTKAIHWFRQDLRIRDNPSLYAAAEKGILLPVYICLLYTSDAADE